MAEGTVERAERERDLDRLLTFVDAIVAIAITLLVLPLVELVADLDHYRDVGSLLRHNGDELWSFVLSFYVIARIWLAQHDAVSPVLSGTKRLNELLIVWTFTIVFLPFPTALVASAGGEAVTKVLYVGTMALSLLIVAGLRFEVARHPEITDGARRHDPLVSLAPALLLLVALVVMLAIPATSYFPILLLFLGSQVETVLARLRNRHTT